MEKGTTNTGELVARTGFKRELQFVLKSQSEICGGESLGRTRADTRNLNVESTSMGVKMKRRLVYAKRRMATSMSDLHEDLVSEILSRVPITSLGSIRSTCKQWNVLSRNRIFGKVAEAKNLFLGFMLIENKICSVRRIDLQGIRHGTDKLSIKEVNVVNQVNQQMVFTAYHCDGLLLFCTDESRLLVWNPYLGQTRWIQYEWKRSNSYALGYDNNGNHKILEISEFGHNIYELSSNSWKVFDVTHNWELPNNKQSVNLKGNTFFFAVEKERNTLNEILSLFLLSFDFILESFGPSSSLPLRYSYDDTLTLSCVGDEKLAVLVQTLHRWERPKRMEIWITNKIDCNEVVWTKWMQVDCGRGFLYSHYRPYCESFLIDEEKKVAVVFGRIGCEEERLYQFNYDRERLSSMFGEDGYCHLYSFGHFMVPKLLSYVPSFVQIY